MTDDALKKTPLHGLHGALGARMAGFAGYDMPIQYPLGVLKEHAHAREAAGLFDVSHMGQIRLTGPGAARALEALAPIDVEGLEAGRQRYGLFTNEEGGILDDFMVSNASDHLFLVVNAACKAADFARLAGALPDDAEAEMLEGRGLIALQGPAARAVLARHAPEAAEMAFMTARPLEVAGVDCFVSCSGYTGEDGYEISAPADATEALARTLLAEPEVAPIGLGARDSLRLEAGLCLYGHDIDATTNPVEAALWWAISSARRPGGAREGGFPGAQAIFAAKEAGPARRRVGLKPLGRAPVREGAAIVDGDGATIGWVTSGGFGPTVGGPVAMGYVAREHAKLGTELAALVRGKALPMTVVKTPFSPHNYHRG